MSSIQNIQALAQAYTHIDQCPHQVNKTLNMLPASMKERVQTLGTLSLKEAIRSVTLDLIDILDEPQKLRVITVFDSVCSSSAAIHPESITRMFNDPCNGRKVCDSILRAFPLSDQPVEDVVTSEAKNISSILYDEMATRVVEYLNKNSFLNFSAVSKGMRHFLRPVYLQARRNVFSEMCGRPIVSARIARLLTSYTRLFELVEHDLNQNIDETMQNGTTESIKKIIKKYGSIGVLQEKLELYARDFISEGNIKQFRVLQPCLRDNFLLGEIKRMIDAQCWDKVEFIAKLHENISLYEASRVVGYVLKSKKFESIKEFFIELKGPIPEHPLEARSFFIQKVEESEMLLDLLENNNIGELLQRLNSGAIVLTVHLVNFLDIIVQTNNIEVLRALVIKSEIPEVIKKTTFMLACERWNLRIVYLLLGVGVQVSAANRGKAVRLASERRNWHIVRAFLEGGMDIPEHDRGEALVQAVRGNNYAMVRFLLPVAARISSADISIAQEVALMIENQEIHEYLSSYMLQAKIE